MCKVFIVCLLQDNNRVLPGILTTMSVLLLNQYEFFMVQSRMGDDD